VATQAPPEPDVETIRTIGGLTLPLSDPATECVGLEGGVGCEKYRMYHTYVQYLHQKCIFLFCLMK